ncbi:DUF2752 domain-containing protein [Lutibacter sp.]
MKLKYFGVLILAIGLAFLYFFINPSEVDFLPKCPLYVSTGIYCPGCGSQRATHHLLRLDFWGVIQQNILYFVALFVLAYHFIVTSINLLFKKRIYNYIYHPKTPIIILIVVIVFWILRNIPYYPFNLLAPH